MKKALLIGIHYTDISGATLKGCINDIINMRNMLIDSYDFNSDDIIMLRDDDILKFQPPTYFNILDCLSSIVKESNNLEEFWLHYSGHGSRIQTNNSNSGFSEIIIPVDFRESACITDIELLDVNFYACFEEACFEYSAQVNQFNIRNNMGVLQGSAANVNLTQTSVEGSGLPLLVKLSEGYGTEFGVGGTVDWKKGHIHLSAGTQSYDLQAL